MIIMMSSTLCFWTAPFLILDCTNLLDCTLRISPAVRPVPTDLSVNLPYLSKLIEDAVVSRFSATRLNVSNNSRFNENENENANV